MVYNMIYHNVVFRTILKNDFDIEKVLCFRRHTRKDGTTMKEIASWCKTQGIEYSVSFRWIPYYSILANLWNLCCYLRFKYEEKQALPLEG